MDYITYFKFLSDVKQMIKDTSVDFKLAGYQGDTYDTKYKSFINKLIGKCETYNKSTLLGESVVIKQYMNVVRNSLTDSQSQRFTNLLNATQDFITKVC